MRGSGPRFVIIAVLLLGLLIFGGVYYAYNTATDIFQPVTTTGTGKTIPFEISTGETTADIANDLQGKGLIRNALAFRIWARIKGLDTHLEAGIYKTLNTDMTISDIIDKLLNAQPDAVRVIIPEDWRVEQVARRFASAGLVNFKEATFLKYTQHIEQFPDAAKYPILKSVPTVNGMTSMEGLLYPAGYEIPVNADARYVVNLLLRTLDNNIQQHHLDTLAHQHQLSVYQMIILASIVEREVAYGPDRVNIASVYWNRILRPNDETVGLLQADPTVQYARDTLTKPDKYWVPLNDSPGNIAHDSPWNTYVNKGWPPTPICSPGLASLEAAAAPVQTDYYYFLSKKDGHAVFAKTNAEFEQDKQKYLQ